MTTIDSPPAIIKGQEDISKLTARAAELAEELKHRRAVYGATVGGMNVAVAERNLADCRDDLDRQLTAFIDGEHSIESRWRNICAGHAAGALVANESEMGLVRDWFDQHGAFLDVIYRAPLFATLTELGFLVPSFDKLPGAIQKTQEIRDQVLERWPLTNREFAYVFPVDVEEVVYIPPTAFLRSMITIIWNVFRHPFSTTYVDLSTGDSVTFVDEAE